MLIAGVDRGGVHPAAQSHRVLDVRPQPQAHRIEQKLAVSLDALLVGRGHLNKEVRRTPPPAEHRLPVLDKEVTARLELPNTLEHGPIAIVGRSLDYE